MPLRMLYTPFFVSDDHASQRKSYCSISSPKGDEDPSESQSIRDSWEMELADGERRPEDWGSGDWDRVVRERVRVAFDE